MTSIALVLSISCARKTCLLTACIVVIERDSCITWLYGGGLCTLQKPEISQSPFLIFEFRGKCFPVEKERICTEDREESGDNGDDKEAVKKLELVTVLVRQAWLQ